MRTPTETRTAALNKTGAGVSGRRLPAAVWMLGAAVFCLGTTAFVVAGLQPDLTDGLHIRGSE